MSERVIWKVALNATDVQTIGVPAGSEFLCTHEQLGEIYVWFMCDPKAPKERRTITMRGTGTPASSNDGRYLGTIFLSGGRFVFHVFVDDMAKAVEAGDAGK